MMFDSQEQGANVPAGQDVQVDIPVVVAAVPGIH
jgi:hypothetical protein